MKKLVLTNFFFEFPLRIELRSQDSKSCVITITLWELGVVGGIRTRMRRKRRMHLRLISSAKTVSDSTTFLLGF